MAGLEVAVAGPMAGLEVAVAGPMAGLEGAVAAPAPPSRRRNLVLDGPPGPFGRHRTCQVPPAKRQHGPLEGGWDNAVLQGQVCTMYCRVRCVLCTAGSGV